MFNLAPSTNPLYLMYLLQQQSQNQNQNQQSDPSQMAMLAAMSRGSPSAGMLGGSPSQGGGLFPNYDSSPLGKIIGHMPSQVSIPIQTPGSEGMRMGNPGNMSAMTSGSGLLGFLSSLLGQ